MHLVSPQEVICKCSFLRDVHFVPKFAAASFQELQSGFICIVLGVLQGGFMCRAKAKVPVHRSRHYMYEFLKLIYFTVSHLINPCEL